MTLSATLNCKVDLLAKQFAMEHIASNNKLTFQHSSLDMGTTIYSGYLISSRMQKIMYKTIIHSKLLDIHAERKEIPASTFQFVVNWEVLGKTRKESSPKLSL